MGEAAQKSWSGARVVWAAPDAHCTDVLCRSCGVLGPKPPLLFAAVWETPARRRSVALVACPACGCAFAPEPESVAYEIEDEDHEATTDFYVQAGAGLWPIIRPLTRQRTPPGSRYLEVGCGYGFGLDYAIRACGLEGVGIDPSPAAARGREELGLPIELRYLSSEDATAVRADLVFASEVLEHVDDPLFLLRMLRAALAPTGLLIVTTPDRAALVPDRPPSDFLHVLSIGHHITLQTEASLGVLLHRAGFDHVRTEAADDQLVAFASMEPLLLTEAPAESRRRFRDHLRSRVAELTSATSLFWGFAGRAYQEAVIDGAWDEAAALWTRLRAACEERFSFNIDAPEDYPDLQACSVSELAERIPLALPNLLYARVLQKVKHGGETITNVLPLLRQVAELGVSLISALRAGR